MNILLQFLLSGLIFFIVGYFTWWLTEDKDIGHIPKFLDYRPFQCRLCLTFWLLVAVYVALGISFELWVFLIFGIILAILNAIAMHINQKNKTISIDDLNNDE